MSTITFRKTKSGEWVACGDLALMQEVIANGGECTITKRDGSTVHRTVLRLGKPFGKPGAEQVYGYLADETPRRTTGYRSKYRGGGRPRCKGCGETIDPKLNGADYGAAGYCFDCA